MFQHWSCRALANGLRQSTERNVWLKWSLADPFPLLSNCLPATPAASNTQNRHQLNVLLLQDPDATKVAVMPLKFSKKATLEPFGFLNRENATYALGHVACQSWVLIVTLLSQSRGKHSQESLSSLKCGVPSCRQTSEHGEETDVWTFAVKLSQTLCQEDRVKKAQTLLATICQLQCRSEKS